MGRTYRLRKRKQHDVCSFTLSCDATFINLVKWMMDKNWAPTCDLQPVSYLHYGRGLMTKSVVKKGDVIFSLPFHLMITTAVVEKSPIACVFQNGNFNVQEVISLFLVCERLQQSDSHWYEYVKTLPLCFSLPLFCSSEERLLLPPFLVDAVAGQKMKLARSYTKIVEAFKSLKHCHICHNNHYFDFVAKKISYEDFLWAWCVVNTRSVFYERYRQTSIKTVDNDNLALAPYLDLFNHSNESDLKAVMNRDGYYNIVASRSLKKYSQVLIHYGHHSNLHLFVEYGFIIPNNVYDGVSLTIEEVIEVIKNLHPSYSYSNYKKKFITDHNLDKDLFCTAEGMSFNVRALIYILTSAENKIHLHKKIYSNEYNDNENQIITSACIELIKRKIEYFGSILNTLNLLKQPGSPSFSIAQDLVNEYLNLLKKALFCLRIA